MTRTLLRRCHLKRSRDRKFRQVRVKDVQKDNHLRREAKPDTGPQTDSLIVSQRRSCLWPLLSGTIVLYVSTRSHSTHRRLVAKETGRESGQADTQGAGSSSKQVADCAINVFRLQLCFSSVTKGVMLSFHSKTRSSLKETISSTTCSELYVKPVTRTSTMNYLIPQFVPLLPHPHPRLVFPNLNVR